MCSLGLKILVCAKETMFLEALVGIWGVKVCHLNNFFKKRQKCIELLVVVYTITLLILKSCSNC